MPSSQPQPTTEDPFATLHDDLPGFGPGIIGLRSAAEDLRNHPDLLRNALLAVLSSDAAVVATAMRSSVHANGFAKIVLHVGRLHSVRLHVWHRLNGRWVPDVDPHGHRWEFASWIVTGTLEETTFIESAYGVRYEKLAYDSGPDGVFLSPAGRARLRYAGRLVHPAGTVYARSRSVTHTATPDGDGFVASLVLQGPHRFDPTPVYVRPDVERDHTNWKLSPTHLRDLVTEVAEVIQ